MYPPESSARRVAFFGGSFDPPHQGHLAIARAACIVLKLDTVLFAPVGNQPLKPAGHATSYLHRLAMTQQAITGEPGFAVSVADAPKLSGLPNYTVETILRLCRELPRGSELFCLMGADAFAGLRAWHRAAVLPFLAPLIVASRPGQPLDSFASLLPRGVAMDSEPQLLETVSGIELRCAKLRNHAGSSAPFYLLPGLHVEISATEIRSQLSAARRTRRSAHDLLPAPVVEYIRAHKLYQ